jgi:hypothetical protein
MPAEAYMLLALVSLIGGVALAVKLGAAPKPKLALSTTPPKSDQDQSDRP